MSFMTNPNRLDPRTVTDIEHNACAYCEQRPVGRWSICDFHEGYEAALEQHANQLEEAIAESIELGYIELADDDDADGYPSVTDETA